MMKKAFTLVEMLIVVAILAVLMSIVFRLGSVGGDESRRTTTVVRLQKIENCLSGYYAAFGSYPPVKLHGSRDIYLEVDENGDQDPDSNSRESGSLNWDSVNAACRSQPFGCEYPGNDYEVEAIEDWSEEVAARIKDKETYPCYQEASQVFKDNEKISGPPDSGGFSSEAWESTDWKRIKLFKFGLMSFLLPRYLFMMSGKGGFYGISKKGSSGGNACKQWTGNNEVPCDPFTGNQFGDAEGNGNGGSWQQVWNHIEQYENDGDRRELAYIANIPTQAVCARWMPNLERICNTTIPKTFFGVNITESGLVLGYEGSDGEIHPPSAGTHTPDSSSVPYRNASITIYDGWGHEFYYYSPAPYQSYTVWSAGSNGKTFPPWIALENLGSGAETAQNWKKDDIIQMNN